MTVTYSCIQDDDPGDGYTYPGIGNLDGDPLFAGGPAHDYYLSQVASGQAADSPCVDAGSDSAANFGLDALTTRTDQAFDTGTVDMGYHGAAVTVIYVDEDAVGDPGPGDPTVSDLLEDGSAGHPYDAIQEAIYAAGHRDMVMVKDGVYTGMGNRDMDFLGKAITVRSERGADATIIDCEAGASDPHRGFYFHSGEGEDSVVEGFTVTNGYGLIKTYEFGTQPYGGAVLSDGASPTILKCTIACCQAYHGAGIFCISGKPTIAQCVIRDCVAQGEGGGIFSHDCEAWIAECVIADNTSVSNGAGIRCGYSVSSAAGPTVITGCAMRGNAAGNGGGLAASRGGLTITGCVITGNGATYEGGGVLVCVDALLLTNCIISENTAGTIGGGVRYNYPATRSIRNCTICYNTAGVRGGGLSCGDGDASVTDSILWANGPQQVYVDGGTLALTYSDVEGGWPGSHNINADPLFVSGPLHDYYLSQTAAGQAADSPCVDAGSFAADLLGMGRLCTRTDGIRDTGIVDMGYHAPYALAITSITRSGDDITFNWNAQPGLSYVVELSDNRIAWNDVPVGAVSSWTDVGVLAGTPTGAHRYYRVREAAASPVPTASPSADPSGSGHSSPVRRPVLRSLGRGGSFGEGGFSVHGSGGLGNVTPGSGNVHAR